MSAGVVYLCPSSATSCLWEGGAAEMLDHFRSSHKELLLLDSDRVTVDVTKDSRVNRLMVWSGGGEIYLLQTHVLADEQKLWIRLRYLGTEDGASCFRYSVSVISGEMAFEMLPDEECNVIQNHEGAVEVDLQLIGLSSGYRPSIESRISVGRAPGKGAGGEESPRQDKTMTTMDIGEELEEGTDVIREESEERDVARDGGEGNGEETGDVPEEKTQPSEDIVEEGEGIPEKLEEDVPDGISRESREMPEETGVEKEESEHEEAEQEKVSLHEDNQEESKEGVAEDIGEGDGKDRVENASQEVKPMEKDARMADEEIKESSPKPDWNAAPGGVIKRAKSESGLHKSSSLRNSLINMTRMMMSNIISDANHAKADPQSDLSAILDLDKDLKCVNCGQDMLPPIFMCQKGHSACAKCVPNQNCATCDAPFTDLRNEDLEDLSRKTKQSGCKAERANDEIRAHENTYSCHLCQFEGKFAEVKGHLSLLHPSVRVVSAARCQFPRNTTFVMMEDTCGFFYCNSYAKGEGIVWVVNYLGPKDHRHRCELTLKAKKREQRLALKREADGYKLELTLEFLKANRIKDKHAVLRVSSC